MTVVQEARELLAQAFVALPLMPDHDRMLEQPLLYLRRELGPEMNGNISDQ
jgi:hypothetical protein